MQNLWHISNGTEFNDYRLEAIVKDDQFSCSSEYMLEARKPAVTWIHKFWIKMTDDHRLMHSVC